MPPPGDSQGSLLNRSPRSRKSLAVGSTGTALPSTAPSKRKRAHSIAPGENLKMDDARRRSLMRPTKGILKPSNQAEDVTQDLSRAYQTMPQTAIHDESDTTLAGASLGEFRTNVHDNPSRKSFGGRRVSFAAHAHVRVFDSAEQNTNGTSSPASSPAASPSVPAPSDPASPSPSPTPPSPDIPETQPGPSLPEVTGPRVQSPSRRSSLARRRRSSVRGLRDDEGEGEESMDVSEDEIPPPTLVSPPSHAGPSSFSPQSLNVGSQPPSGGVHDQIAANQDPGDSEDDSDYEGEDGDMSMTGEFGAGIVARRRTMSMAGGDRRKSRMRSSIAVPPTVTGEEAKEFTVSLDRPPPPESDAFKALQAIANGNRVADDAADEDEEVDMDVTTAMTRLMAVRNSIGGPADAHNNRDDSFTSTDDSFDGVDAGDRTMNVTNLMGSSRASEYGVEDDGDVTMSATSMVAVPISIRPASAPESAPSTIAPPKFERSPLVPAPRPSSASLPGPSQSSAAAIQSSSSNVRVRHSPSKPIARVASPTKQPIKQFSAAFAPPHQSLKRPLPSSGSGNQGGAPSTTISSPNKRRAVAISESSTQRVSVPVPVAPAGSSVSSGSASPSKGLPNRARRPSGYYRKSFAGAPSENAPTAKQFSSSTAGPSRRQSLAPTVRIVSKKSAVATASKPPPFAARIPTDPKQKEDPHCAREDRRQSVALPSPTRGSPSPGSPAISYRNGKEKQVPDQVTFANAGGEDPLEDLEDITEDLPALYPAPTQGIDPGQWASTVEVDNIPQDDELSPISVNEFFMMTGIRFMDDMTCPRRSTVHPSQLQRRESNDGEDESYPLSDYAVAMTVDVAQLETMSWIANDIRSAIEKYKEQYRQTEKDAANDIPLLFREFATAPEEGREEILYVLKLLKANTIGSAKASWYEWKRGWVQGLQINAERALDNLDADERQLAEIAARAGQTLPSLRTEYDEIMRELEEEQAAVAEIENCDQKFLSELKATIAEQRQELDVYRNDIADGNVKMARLDETLEDLEDQAREAKTAIATAQRQMDMQKSSTRAEVFRLRDELSSLQDLHLWRATDLSADNVEFVYDSKYRVVIPCRRFTPIPEALDVLSLGDQSQADDDFPLVTEIMYRIARRRTIQAHDNKLTLRMIVQRLTDFWASYAQLRWQLSFIVIKYPLSFQLTPTGSRLDDAQGFKATATLLLPKKTSKALISFYFDTEMLCNWPMQIELLKYDVSVVYGNADPRVVGEALEKRLLEASKVENHACLVDACMEVVSRYS